MWQSIPTMSTTFGESRQRTGPDWLTDDAWVPSGEKALYSYARTGLYAVLDQLERGVILVPEYLPRGMAGLFHHLNFDVEYYGVNYDLTLPADDLARKLRDHPPAVVLFVHYLGFADPAFGDLAATAKAAGTFVIEDAARGLFARDTDGALLGTTGDAAVFSPHKTLAAPHGGLVVAPGLTLPAAASPPSEVREAFADVLKRGLHRTGLNRTPTPIRPELEFVDYRTAPVDLPSGLWPPRRPGRFSQRILGRCSPADVQHGRLSRYETLYDEFTAVDGIEVITPEPYDDACPYGVAVHVPAGATKCNEIIAALFAEDLPVDSFRWAVPFPEADLPQFPDAHALRFEKFIIPTAPWLDERSIPRIVETVAAQL